MRCIKDIVGRFDGQIKLQGFWTFASESRITRDFKIFTIFTFPQVGPGSPFDGDGNWDLKYFDF